MTSLTRVCPFDGCGKRISSTLFACRPHWFSLNGRQKADIWDAYNAWQEGTISAEELRAVQQRVLDEVQGKDHSEVCDANN